MAKKEALKVRTAVKKRKPTFRRSQAHQFKKLNDGKWRRPKGMGNKVRRNRRGKPGMLQVGYKSPKLVRGFNKEGLKEVIIANVASLSNIEKDAIAVISSKVGGKKKMEILAEAKKKNVKIANVKNVESKIKALTKVKKEVKKKVEAKSEVKAEKADTKKEAKKADPKEDKKE